MRPIRVGIIGVNSDASWAFRAHLPALKALASYEVRAVCSTTLDKAESVRRTFDIPIALNNHRDLIERDDIDLVVVTTKAPTHFALVEAALSAGKDVFCEWPLGSNLAETKRLAELAASRRSLIGLQGRFSTVARTVKGLIESGYVGRVLSSSAVITEPTWGPIIPQHLAYTLDFKSGANIVSVGLGHFLDIVSFTLGGFINLNASIATLFKSVAIRETKFMVPVTAPDHAAITGTLNDSAIVAVHISPGQSFNPRVDWRINGTEGEVLVKSDDGRVHIQEIPVLARKIGEAEFTVFLPPSDHPSVASVSLDVFARGVARLYGHFADEVPTGGPAPDFSAAAHLHRLVDSIYAADSRHLN
jgi:predicted dehydrogenase